MPDATSPEIQIPSELQSFVEMTSRLVRFKAPLLEVHNCLTLSADAQIKQDYREWSLSKSESVLPRIAAPCPSASQIEAEQS